MYPKWLDKLLSGAGLFYFFLALTVAIGSYILFDEVFKNSNSYFIWFLAINMTTLLIYGLDKLIAPLKDKGIIDVPRVPNVVLHLLNLVGGFVAGTFWILFFHKKNWRDPKNLNFPKILLVSIVLYIMVYALFLRNS